MCLPGLASPGLWAGTGEREKLVCFINNNFSFSAITDSDSDKHKKGDQRLTRAFKKALALIHKIFGSVRSSGCHSVCQSVWHKFVLSNESSSFSHSSVSGES